MYNMLFFCNNHNPALLMLTPWRRSDSCKCYYFTFGSHWICTLN